MIEAHLKKLRRRDEIIAAEEEALRGAVGEVRKVRAGETIIRAGAELNVSLLLIDGWLARTKDLAGGQRLITELHVPGDFADLHSFTLKRLDHDVVAMTRSTIVEVPHEKLRRITERHPHLTRVYWFSTNVDASIQRERTLSMGLRPALSRTAHLMCELFARLEIVGLTSGNECDLPLTQVELGECLGLTAVHVNRTLQELRRKGLIKLENRRLTILDPATLRQVAEFDPAYLYLERKPR